MLNVSLPESHRSRQAGVGRHRALTAIRQLPGQELSFASLINLLLL